MRASVRPRLAAQASTYGRRKFAQRTRLTLGIGLHIIRSRSGPSIQGFAGGYLAQSDDRVSEQGDVERCDDPVRIRGRAAQWQRPGLPIEENVIESSR
jgi:hypothetical protein